MSVQDVTRHLFQPGKQYSGARMQQGRVLLDSDWNEHAAIVAEESRRALLDVVGGIATSDDGFSLGIRAGDTLSTRRVRFGDEPEVEVLDLTLQPGTLYLGGHRLELAAPEPVWAQRDFLSMRTGDAPIAPAAGATKRYLAWIEAREHAVSAVEDEEILEKALGGPDTTTRVRRTRRVRVIEIPDEGPLSCEDAFARVIASLGARRDATSGELRSDARLRLELEEGPSEDPCATPSGGRYLGAENQTLRIQLTAPDRYVWAFDDGAPLYRVEVRGDEVTLLTLPRDEHHMPVAGTVIELLAWGALLENGQRCAEAAGVVAHVTETRGSPRVLGIPPDAVTRWNETVRAWRAPHPETTVLSRERFAYARIWHRAAESDPIEIPIASGRALGRTGLVPRFLGTGRAGDHWIASVRPADATRVVPWQLESAEGAAVAGPRVWAAPLAVLRVEGRRVTELVDCRPRFRPLTEQQGCCTVSVGDGVHSFGDFTSIQRAIDALPASGGRVCVRPGTYREEIALGDREGVELEGCGTATVIETPSEPRADALISIAAARRITIRDLAIRVRGQAGIRVGAPRSDAGEAPRAITIREVSIDSGPDTARARATRSGIEAHEAEGLFVRECVVRLDGSRSDDAGIFASGDDLRIERTHVHTAVSETVPLESRALAFGATHASFAWGGIQIGGGSARVVIRGCRIEGGLGHGITLGSVVWRSRRRPDWWIRLGPGFWWFDPADPCPVVRPSPGRWVRVPGGEEHYPVSGGDLEDVEIADNHVLGAATNGISVIATLLPRLRADGTEDTRSDHVTITNLHVAGNRIERSVLRPSTEMPGRPVGDLAFRMPTLVHGGIVLGEVVRGRIEGNVVESNGPSDRVPITGVHVLLAESVSIERNVIRENGPRDASGEGAASARGGVRGGVVVTLGALGGRLEPSSTDPTLRVRANVIEQPAGPALKAWVAGPLVVDSNHLASGGDDDTSRTAISGAVLELLDLGGRFEPSAADLPTVLTGAGLGGQVLVQGNQIVLDWRRKRRALRATFGAVVLSLDDVRIVGNQWATILPGTGSGSRDRLVASVFAVGATLHASTNRFSEGMGDVVASFYGLAHWMCTVAHNEATHCVLSACSTSRHVASPNLELDTAGCARIREGFASVGPRWSTALADVRASPRIERRPPMSAGPRLAEPESALDPIVLDTVVDLSRTLRGAQQLSLDLTRTRIESLEAEPPPSRGEVPARSHARREELLARYRTRAVDLERFGTLLERREES